MALILANTDVLIDYLEGIPPIQEWIGNQNGRRFPIHRSITSFELLSDAREGRRGDRVRRLVMNLPVLPLDRESAERAAAVRQQLEREGRAIGMAGSLIAGIALVNDMPLLTRNRKHFSRVPGLVLTDGLPSIT